MSPNNKALTMFFSPVDASQKNEWVAEYELPAEDDKGSFVLLSRVLPYKPGWEELMKANDWKLIYRGLYLLENASRRLKCEP